MEVFAKSWIPRTERNRWAWGFAWASLAVFLLWNLMPEFDYDHSQKVWVKKGVFIMAIWPDVIGGLSIWWQFLPDFEAGLLIVYCLALIFLALIQFLFAPLWRMISASRILRFIPLGLCLIGGIIVVYIISDVCIPLREDQHFALFNLSLISLNFLLSALSLLLYHPETEPIPES